MNFKTFLKFSKIQYYYSELRWNNSVEWEQWAVADSDSE